MRRLIKTLIKNTIVIKMTALASVAGARTRTARVRTHFTRLTLSSQAKPTAKSYVD